MLAALVAFTSANNEQIKDAEQIGMNVYSWNDFLKMVGKENLQYSSPFRLQKLVATVVISCMC
jgi:long-chain acyl-CoA synthetase